MVETRCAPRFKVWKSARIGSDREAARCIVRDLSTTGAALELENPTDAPERFTLVIPEDSLSLPCRVIGAEDTKLASYLISTGRRKTKREMRCSEKSDGVILGRDPVRAAARQPAFGNIAISENR
jgi:hypothetical protein